MITEIRNRFNAYSKKYDLKNKEILSKFHHSFRVMELSKEIAISLSLNEHDINICTIIGLLHDIGRYEQLHKYKTYSDEVSIDHGDYGVTVINDNNLLEGIDECDKEIILKAIKNHNKFNIEEGLNDREILFCKIIRDADKLDIIKEQGSFLVDNYNYINPKILESFDNNMLCDDKYLKNSFDNFLRNLLLIYDLNFNYSYEFIIRNRIIENKINILENHYSDYNMVKYIENKLINYIKSKGEFIC